MSGFYYPSVDDRADDAYEGFADSCDVGALCPSCWKAPNELYPITVTLDMQGTIYFRCEWCGHEWPDPYQHTRKVAL